MKRWVRYRHFMIFELTLAPVFAGAGFMLNCYAAWPVWLVITSCSLGLTAIAASLVVTGRSAVRRMAGMTVAATAPLFGFASALSALIPNCRWGVSTLLLALYVVVHYAAYKGWPRWAMKPWVFTAATVTGWAAFAVMVRFYPALMERGVSVLNVLAVVLSGETTW